MMMIMMMILMIIIIDLQQEGASEENNLGKPNAPFEEDPTQAIINQGKVDSNESPNRCWSSKDSSGSNQTDISTVVNPATSVPITAPGSPDPDGSEASDGAASESEGHDAGIVDTTKN